MSWFSSWTRAQRLAITVPAGVTAACPYFPVLLTAACLPSEITNNTYGRSDGGDLAFAADSSGAIGAQIPCEIVNASFGGSPAAEIWVQVPSLAATGTTTYLWVLYGNASQIVQPSVASTYGAESVWLENGTQNVNAVWHFGKSGALNFTDSSFNGNTGTGTGVTAASGPFGQGATFDGSHLMSFANIAFAANTVLTLSAWINVNAWSELPPLIANSSTTNGFRINGNGVAGPLQLRTNAANGSSTTTLALTTWYHVAASRDTSGNVAYYLNGSPNGTTNSAADAFTFNRLAMCNTGAPRYFTGLLDEVKITALQRTASWIAAEYSNQHAPSGFVATSGSPLPLTFWVNGSPVVAKVTAAGTIAATSPTFAATGTVSLSRPTLYGTIGDIPPHLPVSGGVALRRPSPAGSIGVTSPAGVAAYYQQLLAQ